MKKAKQILALTLALLMLFPALAACRQNTGETASEAALTATPVQYNKSGAYTTTVSSDKVDLSGVAADNVEVRYLDLNRPLTAIDPSTPPKDASAEPVVEETFSLTAAVNSVKANENGGYDIRFTDKDAADFATGYYCVVLKSVNACVGVNVEFPSVTLTSDVESVYIGTEKFRVALTINGAEFEDGLNDDDVYLNNAFEKADVEILSKSAGNLTLEISGALTKNAADAYQWGVIGIKPTGIKNGFENLEAKIPVKMDYAAFDESALAFADGKVTADLKVYGVAEVDELGKDNVTVEGVTVESLAKADDNTLRLTLSADGVTSVNDFADLVGGGKMTLGAYETDVLLSQATFYPVFDYIEKSGEAFDITLKLYVYGGTADDTLTPDRIGLSGDFEGAAVKSLTADDSHLATLILSVPAGGFTEDDYQFEGAVTLKAGAVTNAWGEKTTADTTYTRNYSAETLGKEVSLNTDTLLEIQKYTRGMNTTFGKICHYGGIAGQVFSISKSILEATGVIKSEHAQVMEQLTAMDQKLDNIQSGITDVKKSIAELVSITELLAKEEEKREIRNKIDSFETLLIDLYHTLDAVKAVQQRAALDMALEEAGVIPDYIGMTSAQVAAEKARLRKTYLPDIDSMTDRDAALYNIKVMNYINSKASNPGNTEYYSYYTRAQELESKFKVICGMLDKSTASNPIGFYDELCALTYNFDSQTYDFRLANRVALQYNLVDALAVLAFHYKAAATPDSDLYSLIGAAFDKAMASSIWEVSGHSRKEIKANTRTEYKSNVLLDNDEEYFPYCYTLGCKISIYISADCSNNDAAMAKSKKWSLTESRDFLSRMHSDTFEKELKSAGISIDYTSDGWVNRYRGRIACNYKYVSNGHSYNLRIYFMWDNKTIDGYNGSNPDGTPVGAYEGFHIFFMCH